MGDQTEFVDNGFVYVKDTDLAQGKIRYKCAKASGCKAYIWIRDGQAIPMVNGNTLRREHNHDVELADKMIESSKPDEAKTEMSKPAMAPEAVKGRSKPKKKPIASTANDGETVVVVADMKPGGSGDSVLPSKAKLKQAPAKKPKSSKQKAIDREKRAAFFREKYWREQEKKWNASITEEELLELQMDDLCVQGGRYYTKGFLRL